MLVKINLSNCLQYKGQKILQKKDLVASIIQHKRILIQVFFASFFVQLFQLFNPLLIQQIIDAVVSQGNVNSLNIYGTLLITFAIGEASLGFLRTYLFNDTTNRIDISLGTKIINHLFKLPFSYFSNRPTGEISNRINELTKIRNFLTSRALTLVLDTLFCFIYISVMLIIVSNNFMGFCCSPSIHLSFLISLW